MFAEQSMFNPKFNNVKKLLVFLVLTTIARIGFSQQAAATTTITSTEVAVFQWDSQVFDFGKIKQGVPVTHEFKFSNAGKVTLLITNAQASCGCTTPDWTKDPVPPGKNGFIKATYSAGGSGAFDKTVTVTSNADGGPVVLRIKGEVVPAVQ